MMYRTTSYSPNQWNIFYFEKNLQGDVIALYNSSGTRVAYYTYEDAWGNHVVGYTNLHLNEGAQYNPFRYRGYYYDTDLGMYYLQSRYYDSKICRFINADSYVSTGQGILGSNMFAYCNNNPITNIDPSGESLVVPALILLGGAILGGIFGGFIMTTSATSQEEEASSAEIIKGVAVGTAIGVSAAGFLLVAISAPSIVMRGVTNAMVLGIASKRVAALGILASNIMPMILLPLLGLEGEAVEYGDSYNPRQPIFK